MKCWNSAQVNNAGVSGMKIDVNAIVGPPKTDVGVSLLIYVFPTKKNTKERL